MKHGSKNIDHDPHEAEALPEARLLMAVFRQAVLDACCMTEATARRQHDGSNARDWRRKARMWFKDRGTHRGGWYWLANLLDFSPEIVADVHRRIEEDQVIVHPFVPKAQADARRAGVVKTSVKAVRAATVAVGKITGQLEFAWWDNGGQTAPRTTPAKRPRVLSTLVQPALWAD